MIEYDPKVGVAAIDHAPTARPEGCVIDAPRGRHRAAALAGYGAAVFLLWIAPATGCAWFAVSLADPLGRADPVPKLVVVCFTALAALVSSIWWTRRHRNHTLRRLAERVELDSRALVAGAMRVFHSTTLNFTAPVLLSLLRSRGARNIAVRIAPERHLLPLGAPLNVAFEPVPLDERDERFQQLVGHATTPTTPLGRSGSPVVRRVRRLLAHGIVRTGVIVMCTVGFASVVLWGVRVRSAATDMVWLAGMVATVAFAVHRVFRSPAAAEHFAVPGGVACPKLTGAGWYVFDRCRSVLVAERVLDGSWRFHIRDTGDRESFGQATTAEIELLLCAWLSPQAPPTAQQLESLA
ncbi:MAG: hypothetical protein AB7Q17_04345 [Phycisphaerae bacterium]